MAKTRTRRHTESLGKEIWGAIIESFREADSREKVEELFNNLLTDYEKDDLARRLAILSLVRQGGTYSEISKKLWVSPSTISSIKKSLISKNGYKSRQDLERIKRGDKIAGINSQVQLQSSWLDEWFNHLEFLIATHPQMNGPRWRFLNTNQTLPKKYWHN